MVAPKPFPAITEKRRLRFWSHVAVTSDATECWPWTGARFRSGYGEVSFGGRQLTASRVAFALTYGPPERLVLHSCDNRLCCNPRHLREGTHAENMRDRNERGRTVAGGDHNAAKTECPAGHPYDEVNTYVEGGRRHCRICHAEHNRRWRAKNGR